MLNRAEPRTIQAVLSYGTKNCSSVTKAMEHFQTLYPTAGADGTAKSIPRRVGHCVCGCAGAGEFRGGGPKAETRGYPAGKRFWTRGSGSPRHWRPASTAAVGDVRRLRLPRQGCDGHGSGRVDVEVQLNRAGSWTVEVHAPPRPHGDGGAGAEDVDSGAAVRLPRISSMEAPQGVVLLARCM